VDGAGTFVLTNDVGTLVILIGVFVLGELVGDGT